MPFKNFRKKNFLKKHNFHWAIYFCSKPSLISKRNIHSVYLSFLLAEGVEPPTEFSQRGGFTGSQFLEKCCWESRSDLLQGVVVLTQKNKLKSGTLMTKKFINKNISSVITRNINWQILTKNLITFKRSNGVNDEKHQYYGGSLKTAIFRAAIRTFQEIFNRCVAKYTHKYC